MLKVLILYASSHGKTRKVVEQSLSRLVPVPDVIEVKTVTHLEVIDDYDVLLFFCPTYGDAELQPDMEDFIRRLIFDLTGKSFAICELGGYNGYETFSFGAAVILRKWLFERGASELIRPLSLDSLPQVNWPHFFAWLDQLNLALDAYDRSNSTARTRS